MPDDDRLVNEQLESEAMPSTGTAPATPTSAIDLGAVRELILAANPGVVAEMIAGDSFEALLASVAPAQAAYERIVAGLAAQTPTQAPGAASAPSIPAGQPGRTVAVNPAELSPGAKIAAGLKRRGRS